MRKFTQLTLGFDTPDDQAATWRENADYDADHLLPTRQPDADELRDALNADMYAQQLEAMIYEAEPIIIVMRNIGQMLQDGIDTHAGKHFGELAQDIYNMTRERIEREAGIK